MIRENDIAIEPSASSRLSREVSRWFGNSDFATRPKEIPDAESSDRIDWARVIPFVFMHAICLAVIWVGFSWTALLVTLILYLVRMFAITGFYHRYFSHRTFKTSRAGQFIFGLLGATAVPRGPFWWAAHHRHHHVHSDKPDDVHSPLQHGFFWSHMGWIHGAAYAAADLSRVKDLLGRSGAALPGSIRRAPTRCPRCSGSAVFLLGVLLKHVAQGLHAPTGGRCWCGASSFRPWRCTPRTYTINSLSHRFGRQRYKTGDDSRNNLWLAIITLGEGWHNNHHRYPGAARQGFYWWEFDLTFYMLKLMALLGVIWDLKPVPAAVRAGRRQALLARAASAQQRDPERAQGGRRRVLVARGCRGRRAVRPRLSAPLPWSDPARAVAEKRG